MLLCDVTIARPLVSCHSSFEISLRLGWVLIGIPANFLVGSPRQEFAHHVFVPGVADACARLVKM